MNQSLLNAVSQEIYRRFPEAAGVRPKVQAQKSQSAQISAAPTYLLTFQYQAKTVGDRKLPRSIRVVVDEQGRILKVSTSR